LAENIEAENSYDVGYRKPPPAGRFAKGRSGNPTGRPKGAKNLASIIIREGNQRVQVNGPKGTRTITKNEAVVMQLANQAAKGNLPATRLYLPLIQSIEQSAQNGAPTLPLHELDSSVMHNMVKRIQKLNLSSAPAMDTPKTEVSQ
jgi:hypothetical protein